MGAVAEILEPVGMALHPAVVEEAERRPVARVGRGGGEAAADPEAQRRIVDRAGIAAITNAEETAVPFGRQPHLEADLALDHADDPAERAVRRRIEAGEDVERRRWIGPARAGGNGLGTGDARVGQAQAGKRRAIPALSTGGGSEAGEQRNAQEDEGSATQESGHFPSTNSSVMHPEKRRPHPCFVPPQQPSLSVLASIPKSYL